MSSLFVVAGVIALIVTLQHGQGLYAEAEVTLQVPAKHYIPTPRAKLLAQPFEARTYIGNTGDTLRYRLLFLNFIEYFKNKFDGLTCSCSEVHAQSIHPGHCARSSGLQ